MPEMDDEIDYMHPFGKPEETTQQGLPESEEAKPDAKRMRYSSA